MKTKVATVLAAGAGVALTAGGCGLLPLGGMNPLERITEAANSTEAVESYTAEMDAGGMGMELTAEIAYTTDPESTMQMDMDTMGQSSTVLIRGSEMLVSAADAGMPGGPEWLRMNAEEMGMDTAGEDLAGQDPMSEVEKLLAASTADEVGEEEIDGVPTTRYSGTYSAEEAVAQLEGKDAEAARQLYDEVGVDTVDFDLFIDDEGMPRRVVTDAGGEMQSTIDFLSFNEPVDITYPSEDQIGDFEDLMSDLENMEGMEDLEDMEGMEDMDF